MLHADVAMKEYKVYACFCSDSADGVTHTLYGLADVKVDDLDGCKDGRRGMWRGRILGVELRSWRLMRHGERGDIGGHVIEVLHGGEHGCDRRGRDREGACRELFLCRIEDLRRRKLEQHLNDHLYGVCEL